VAIIADDRYKTFCDRILLLMKKYRTDSTLLDNITYTAFPGTENTEIIYNNKKEIFQINTKSRTAESTWDI
jgi:hypothetical protein